MNPDSLSAQAEDIVGQMQDQPALIAYQLLDGLRKLVEQAMRDMESMEIGG